LLLGGANVMSEFVAFLKDIRRTKAVEYAFAFLKTGGEYAFAFLKTMDRSEAIGYAVAAVVILLLTIAVT
jgi:hypothetical protein